MTKGSSGEYFLKDNLLLFASPLVDVQIMPISMFDIVGDSIALLLFFLSFWINQRVVRLWNH